jgi:RNA polymerase sigma-70 factor (ECF subfamily)
MTDFTQFVRQYQDMVFSTALRITADRGDAEDIAQDAFLQAHRWYGSLKDSPEAGGWLRRTARNLALNHVTRYRRRFVFVGSGSDEGELEGEAADGDTGQWLYDQVHLVKQALLELPRKFRVPLVLYYYEDMGYAQIAAALKVSLAKVKTDIMRGRRRLRQIIDRLETEHGTT